MTRWARVTTTQNKRPFPATSWEDMKKGSSEGQSQNLPKSKQLEANRLSLKNDAPQAKHKKNKKKKEYLNEDVNGFMEYLRQNSQMLHNGEVIATDSQKVREEIEVALKKDNRREGRRLKRQAAKKNAMVRLSLLSHYVVWLETYSYAHIHILAECDCGCMLDLDGIFLRDSSNSRIFVYMLLYATHLMY